jgi:hypothetical protein
MTLEEMVFGAILIMAFICAVVGMIKTMKL